MIFTETWLDPSIPDYVVAPAGRLIYQQDRTLGSGKTKRGCVCILIKSVLLGWENNFFFLLQTYPNQKPWLNGEVRFRLKQRHDAHKPRDPDEYRKCRSNKQYKEAIQNQGGGKLSWLQYQKNVVWIKDYYDYYLSVTLPEELNSLYAHFEHDTPAMEIPGHWKY